MAWAFAQLRAGRVLKALDVATRFEVAVRTVYRDTAFMRDQWNLPLEYDHARQTWRLTGETTALPPFVLSEGELLAIYFAEKVVAQYRGTPYERELTSAFRKLATQFPDEVIVQPERLLSFLEIDPGPLPEANPAVFRDIMAGIGRGRSLRIRYASASSGRTLDRLVERCRVLNVRGTWYLVAWDERRQAIRNFALQRIHDVRVTETSSSRASQFDLRQHMADAFGIERGKRPVNVVIRFSAAQAPYVRERAWHRSARVQDRIDGGCVLRMRVAVTSELERWLLQYGPDAEVMRPKSLRDAIATRLRAAARLYS